MERQQMHPSPIGKRGEIFASLIGKLRENRNFARGEGYTTRFPSDILVNEENHIAGAPPADVGAGASVVFTIQVPRRALVRKLVVQRTDASNNNGLVISSFKVAGVDKVIAGSVGANIYHPFSFNNPDVDEETPSATPILVTVTNITAAAIPLVNVAVTID